MLSLTSGSELRRFRRGRLPRLAVAAMLLVPLLYGALYLWAFWSPTSHVDRLPVALVNSDTGATRPDGTHLTAGSDLTDQLTDAQALDWHLTDPADAAAGVRDGDVLLRGHDPRRLLGLARLGRRRHAHQRADRRHLQRRELVHRDDARALRDDAGARRGRQDRRSAGGRPGSRRTRVGSRRPRPGVRRRALAARRGDAARRRCGPGGRGRGPGTRRSRCSGQWHGHAEHRRGQVADGSAALADGAGRLARGRADGRLVERLPRGRGAAGRRRRARGGRHGRRADLGPDTGRRLPAGPGADAGDADAAALLAGLGATDTAGMSTQLHQLDAGARPVASGASALHGGLGTLAGSAQTLSDGATSLADGAVAARGRRLRRSRRSRIARPGTAALADGATQLASGTTQVDDGAQQLADGLSDGAAQIPDDSSDQRTARAEAIANPVTLATTDLATARQPGRGLRADVPADGTLRRRHHHLAPAAPAAHPRARHPGVRLARRHRRLPAGRRHRCRSGRFLLGGRRPSGSV